MSFPAAPSATPGTHARRAVVPPSIAFTAGGGCATFSRDMGVQDVVRWLLPREDHFFVLTEQQGAVLVRAAEALATYREAGQAAAEVAKSVQDIEHEGDKLLHQIEDALVKSFVTPIDREDIQHLARRIDDVIDELNHVARSFSLFAVTAPSAPMVRMAELIAAASREVHTGLGALRKADYAGIIAASKRVSAIEKEGDALFREALGALFRTEGIHGKELIRDKELLEGLEEALDRCEDAAEFLAQVATKNG